MPRGGSVPKLSVTVTTPSPDGAVAAQREAVVSASGNPHDVTQAFDFDWLSFVDSSAIAQLTGIVLAPGPHCAVRLQREAMTGAAVDYCDRFQITDANWTRLVRK